MNQFGHAPSNLTFSFAKVSRIPLGLGVLIHASALIAEFTCFPCALGVSSGNSSFLQQSIGMHGQLIGIS